MKTSGLSCPLLAAVVLAAAVMIGGLVAASAHSGQAATIGITIAAAGDIAYSNSGDSATAKLLSSIGPDWVLTLGDDAYEKGSSYDYSTYYVPTWGGFKSITKPSPGNHEYQTPGASGYFGYFSVRPYYSYDVGAWHLISLNSEIAHGSGSYQEQWLRYDLAAHPATCILAYWHRPRFSSGLAGNDASFDAFWRDLYAAHAEIVLNGHDHDYERFSRQNPNGQLDGHGLQEFVVGTGGRSHGSFLTIRTNSVIRGTGMYGVLRLTLYDGSYSWKFLPEAGKSFTDGGSKSCM
jgi:hypothetical protein